MEASRGRMGRRLKAAVVELKKSRIARAAFNGGKRV